MLETYWRAAILNTSLLQPERKRCSGPHVHYVILSLPPGMWPNTSLHIMSSRALTIFAVTAVLWNRTWWSALHTCCTPASVMRARLSVCRCKSTYADTHTHTHTHKKNMEKARQLSIAVPVTLVSEVSRERAEVCVCVSFVYMCVDVCWSKGGGRLSIVLQISWQSTSSWPAGGTRGLSGRCELCCRSMLLLSKTSRIELSNGGGGVRVAFE